MNSYAVEMSVRAYEMNRNARTQLYQLAGALGSKENPVAWAVLNAAFVAACNAPVTSSWVYVNPLARGVG